ncbi:hypothetical protein [Microtetraspora malaysiensis]|uniref:Uncharacterized protein n=1 Tax=Microtetraspora malaysiensis TaxID=161358 RepID=A0ABW6SNQ5_9ACTN
MSPSDQLVAPVPAPAFAQQPAVVSDEARRTLVAALLDKHQEHGRRAVEHEGKVALLAAEVAKERQAGDPLRAKIAELQARLKEIDDRADAMTQEMKKEGLLARQRRDVEQQFAQAAVTFGADFPEAARGEQVDPNPTGLLDGVEVCPCGRPMRWDHGRNAYVHDIPGGFELAGASCRHAPAEGGGDS